MKIVLFVGSGFNYMLADIVKPLRIYTKDENPLHEEITRLNNLWYRFEPLLSPFNNYIPTKSGEELFEAVEGFQKVYNKFIGKSDVDQADTSAMFASRIKKEMQKIGEQFTKFEKEKGYSTISSALPNFGKAFSHTLKQNNVRDFYLCTTNYDGIIDSLLTYYCDFNSKRQFLLKDGFIHGRFNKRLFKNFNCKMAHIHGSYRYSKRAFETVKLNKEIFNTSPVMIYDNPARKEAAIAENHVLSANFLELERQLRVCDKVITIGNSFKTEPHLQKLIKNNFNRSKTTMIVCSDQPDKVTPFLKACYDYPIYTQATTHVKTEAQLIMLFDRLFKTDNIDMLAVA